MDSMLAELGKTANTADEITRHKLMSFAVNLQRSLETPVEMVQRIIYPPLQLATVRIGIDLGVFELLSASKETISLGTLADRTEADPVLLGRILRSLASIGMVAEAANGRYGANKATIALATKGFQGAINHHFTSVNPIYQELPNFLAKTKYANITDPSQTPFQAAYKTNQLPFVWLQGQPERLEAFNAWMSVQRDGLPSWLSVYPFEEGAGNLEPEEILFVDVGGGVGHQCLELKKKYPKLHGRVILEDLETVLQMALPIDGVEHQVQDIFSPQVVRGAKFYYMRNVLHDYPDDRCLVILQNLKAALRDDSIILIDEMIMPETEAHWQATQVDLTMMASLGSMERTLKQWDSLFGEADLTVASRHAYTSRLQDHVTAVVPV